MGWVEAVVAVGVVVVVSCAWRGVDRRRDNTDKPNQAKTGTASKTITTDEANQTKKIT